MRHVLLLVCCWPTACWSAAVAQGLLLHEARRLLPGPAAWSCLALGAGWCTCVHHCTSTPWLLVCSAVASPGATIPRSGDATTAAADGTTLPSGQAAPGQQRMLPINGPVAMGAKALAGLVSGAQQAIDLALQDIGASVKDAVSQAAGGYESLSQSLRQLSAELEGNFLKVGVGGEARRLPCSMLGSSSQGERCWGVEGLSFVFIV